MSGIKWTGPRRWNPIRGCTRISPGCENCYAERLAARMPWGKGFAEMTKAGPRWTGRVELLPERLEIPLRWRKPQLVFMDSTFDLFHESLPDEAIDQVFAAMALAPQHTFQVLTKRARRMRDWFNRTSSGASRKAIVAVWMRFRDWLPAGRSVPRHPAAWPLPNVWLGVSAEDQQRLDERVPELLATPAAVRFVSAEPLLDALDLTEWLYGDPPTPVINWVIVGGESGPRARICEADWVRGVVGQCRHARTPCFVKQAGSNVRDRNDRIATDRPAAAPDLWPEPEEGWADDNPEHNPDGVREEYQGAPVRIHLRDPKGGDPAEWPEDLRVREMPA